MRHPPTLLVVALLFGSVYGVTYKGVLQTSNTCPGDYPVRLGCASVYGCFETTDKLFTCCGCKGNVCYGCKTLALCPSDVGKSCKISHLPSFLLGIVIGVPVGLVVVIGLCIFCFVAIGKGWCSGTSSTTPSYTMTEVEVVEPPPDVVYATNLPTPVQSYTPGPVQYAPTPAPHYTNG